VFGDLDDQYSLFGVGWWYPHPGTSRRIFISDYLLRASQSVEANLVEARLHLLESFGAMDEEDAFVARAVDYDEQGFARVSIPPRTRGRDDLSRFMRDLHIAGFFRAAGSALDCLAASIVGVLAMPQSIQYADLGSVRKALSRPIAPGTIEDQLWGPTRDALDQMWDVPHAGWLAWLLDYRNTLVHRARPMTVNSLKPEATIGRPDRTVPHIRTTQSTMLARDPKRSDIEVLYDSRVPVLTEDARVTFDCVFTHTRGVCEGIGVLLLDVWQARRANPHLLLQPRQQWPNVPSTAPSVFEGCSPGAEPYDPGMFATGRDVVKRMTAASLLDRALTNWATFD
jgi:hypothetical protein